MGKGTFSCVKWLLTMFNFIFLICGLVLCGFGVWMLVSPNNVNVLLGKNLIPALSYILLGIGGMIILISFCGCAGAGLENRCLLCLFFTVLCGIFVTCLVTSILVAVFKKEVERFTSVKLVSNLKEKYGVDGGWTELWDELQTKLSCCGVSGTDAHQVYKSTKWYNDRKRKNVPASCCSRGNNGYPVDVVKCESAEKHHFHPHGCMQMAITKVLEYSWQMIVVLTCVTLVLVGGMVLSLVHLRNIKHNAHRYSEYSHPL